MTMAIDFYKPFFPNIKEWKTPWEKNQESALSALCLSDSCLTRDLICLFVILSFAICEMNSMQQAQNIQHWITVIFSWIILLSVMFHLKWSLKSLLFPCSFIKAQKTTSLFCYLVRMYISVGVLGLGNEYFYYGANILYTDQKWQ